MKFTSFSLSPVRVGGKLWKGAANNNANSSCPSSTTATAGDENGAARTEKEKPPAVRFIQLNDAPMEDDLNGPSAGHKAGGAHHSSAFQQLFPRARKLLLQDLPEADIQRLTASARATNAGYISSTAISRAMSSITSTSTHSSDDLKYGHPSQYFFSIKNDGVNNNNISSREKLDQFDEIPQWNLLTSRISSQFLFFCLFMGVYISSMV